MTRNYQHHGISMKNVLLALCDELSKKNPDRKIVDKLLKQAKILPLDDPMQLTNEVLKKLHSYEDVSEKDSVKISEVQDDSPPI